MRTRHALRKLVLASGLLVAVTYLLSRAADNSLGEPAKPTGPDKAGVLGGPDRYLTYLSTDKPIYRSGEMVYVRGVLLHHATRRPLPPESRLTAVVEIKGPKGDVIASGTAAVTDSVVGFQWPVPENQAGGEYAIHVTQPMLGDAPAERKFEIRAYRAPRLKSQIKFLRDGYGPGDDVVATLHTERAEGGIPAGAQVTVIARVDGAEVFRGTATVDAKGDCVGRFQLPHDIARGEGSLAMAIEDGGVVETASKTIPILLQTVDLTMYPEGGVLVAGLPNRVYFEALTPAKKPADLTGVILDAEGREVATFRSEHEGRGRFAMTPQAGGKYTLKITQPSGIRTQYPLPEVQSQGAVLRAEKEVFPASEPIVLAVGCVPAKGPCRVTLAKREKVLTEVQASIPEDKATTLVPVNFSLSDNDPDGVLIATCWDAEGKPLAERLIFRQPAKAVRVALTTDSKSFVPGGKARVTLETTDELGKPVDAVVGVTVTDDSVLEMVERREQAPRLPVMVLLEGDVRELADAHVYLDSKNPQAPLAVDLLMGTQGWRRFAFVKTEEFLSQHGDAARRVLALRLPALPTDGMMMEGAPFPAMAGGVGGGMGGMPHRGLARGARLVEEEAKMAPGGLPVPQAAPANALPAAAAAPPALNRGAGQRERAEQAQAGDEMLLAKQRDLRGALDRARELDRDIFQGEARRKRLAAEPGFALRQDFVAVRIYAHQVRAGRQPGERVDFTETLFWHAGLKTGPEGKATVEFALNDAVSSFRVFADAFSAAGGLGSSALQIDSVEPFYLEPKLPLEVTMDDVIQVPVSVVNGTGAPLDTVAIKIQAHGSQEVNTAFPTFTLPPSARLRHLMHVHVGKFNGKADFTLSAVAGAYRDQVTRNLLVKPLGFPVEDGRGGLLESGGEASYEVTVPEDLVKRSLQTRIVVYPTPLASMTEALERLIQEPCGCFEQTSSSVYPLVMAQQYFMTHQGVDPSLIERSSQILTRGYERLLGFECKNGGFEWFGQDPGHDALTAYGLLEFTDMSRVRSVDPAMLERTRKWLLGQRDGKGGFTRKTHTLHTWLAEPEIAYPYDTWALLEAGVDADLKAEVSWVREAAERAQNTYAVALGANVLALAGDAEGSNHLLDKLAGKQTEDGSLKDATVSVVGSGGDALAIETTALAVLAWLKNPRYADNVERSIKYLAESCKAGRFGSTQSTVLALRAIVAYDQSRAQPKAPGSLQLVVDGQAVGQPVEFTADTKGAIPLPDAAAQLTPGKHQLQVKMTGGSRMPYSMAVKYNRLKPHSSEACKLHLQATLRNKQVDEGSMTEAEVTVVNRTGETVPTPVAIVGIPGGLEVRHDQLKELVKAGKIDAYEVLGREVVLYWRALKAEERVDVPVSLLAAIPGTFTGPASRAYLYYTDEHKQWVDGLKVEIAPKAPRG